MVQRQIGCDVFTKLNKYGSQVTNGWDNRDDDEEFIILLVVNFKIRYVYWKKNKQHELMRFVVQQIFV